MVVSTLDNFLPIELVDEIYKLVQKDLMRQICEKINHKIVFTVYDEESLSFLICENQNYYIALDTDQFAVLVQ
jgi:hypothetical protein